MRKLGAALLFVTLVGALFAPVVAPHAPEVRFSGLLNAPPSIVHVRGTDGGWRAPFLHPWTRVSQLEQQYDEDRTRAVPIAWFHNGRLAQSSDDDRAPLLLLGADSFGRDVFSRLLFGARTSLTLSLAAAVAALCAGAVIGSIAGFNGGAVDQVLMRLSELVLLLPAVYVALALRAVMPLVLPPATVFLLLAGIFAVVGAPFIARGVRAIVRTERALDYAVAATSLGASGGRLLFRHLMPATLGFMTVQLILLVPSFIVAEATLSYVGLGFPDPVVSWGTMLQDASNIRSIADFPWLLSPAAAIFGVVLGLNLLLDDRQHAALPYDTRVPRTSVSPPVISGSRDLIARRHSSNDAASHRRT